MIQSDIVLLHFSIFRITLYVVPGRSRRREGAHFFVSCESLSSIIHPSLHIKYTQQSYVNSNCSTT